MTVLRESRPVARKGHRCDWCRQPIRPGHRYIVTVAIWEGDFVVERSHQWCRWVVEMWFDELGYDDSVNFEIEPLIDELTDAGVLGRPEVAAKSVRVRALDAEVHR